MALPNDETLPAEAGSHTTTCTVDISPDLVDAGDEITLRASVACSPACDLRGHTLTIKDQAGADVGSIELTEFDGAANTSGDVVVTAPVTPGTHTWVAVCPAVVGEGVSYVETSTPISFTVNPHTAQVVAWDIPSAIVGGERFAIKVGIKCAHECNLTNGEFEVFDHEGAPVATGTLRGDRWPGTTALHFAEAELAAPEAEGLYTWSVKGPSAAFRTSLEGEAALAHARGSVSFGVRVVAQPECLVTVEAVDRESQIPVAGARVVMHPYKAVTDERGVAEVRVAKGSYRLFVSQMKYVTFGVPLDVTADVTTRAELDVEPVLERN
jgi:hypothetical protein